MSLHGDPFLEAHLDAQLKRVQMQMDALQQQITPEMVANTALIARYYPTFGPQITAAAGMAQVPASDPRLLQLGIDLSKQAADDDKGFWGTLAGGIDNVWDTTLGIFKGGVRTAFTAFDFMWEEGIARPFKTAVGMAGWTDEAPMGFMEAWKKAGTSYGARALGKILSGNWDEINLGSGFIPQSTTTDEYKEAWEQERDGGPPIPEAVRSRQIEEYGDAMTHEARLSQEQMKWHGMSISPGRFAAITMNNLSGGAFLEPGTVPFNLLSGILDATAQIGNMRFAKVPNFGKLPFIGKQLPKAVTSKAGQRLMIPVVGDPAGTMLKHIGAIRGNRKLFSTAEEIAAATWLQNLSPAVAGAVERFRRSVSGPTFDEWVGSPIGRAFVRFLDDEVDDTNIAQTIDFFLQRNKHLPKEFFDQIARSTNLPGKSSADVMRRYLMDSEKLRAVPTVVGPIRSSDKFFGKAGSKTGAFMARPFWSGPLRTAPEAAIDGALGRYGGFRTGLRAGLDSHGWGRLFREMGNKDLDIVDFDQGFRDLNDFLISAHMSTKDRSYFLMRWARETNDILSNAAAYNIATDAFAKVADDLEAAGMPEVLAKAIRDNFNTHDSIRKYFVDDAGRAAFHPLSRYQHLIDGVWRVLPTPQLVDEYLQRAIPLPDARQMRKALSPVRRMLDYSEYDGALKTFWLKSHLRGEDQILELNENAIQRGLDIYMQKFWKPMTLLRVAWPVRVIGEEQLRIAAVGLDAFWSHPIQAISWMISNPGRNALTRTLVKMGIEPRGRVLSALDSLDPAALDSLDPAALRAALKDAGLTEEDVLLHFADEYKSAMNDRGGWLWGMSRNPWVRNAWVDLDPGKDPNLYYAAWLVELAQLHSSPLARIIAADGVDAAKAWIDTAKGQDFVNALMRQAAGANEAKRLADKAAQYALVDAEAARLVIKNGGKANLRLMDDSGETVLAGFDNLRLGDELPQEVIDAIEAGQFHRIQYQYNIDDLNKDIRRYIATGEWRDLGYVGKRIPYEQRRRMMKDLKGEDLAKHRPAKVKGAITEQEVYGKGLGWDRAVEYMFTQLMSRPTNTLSRSPAFKQILWKFMEDSIPFQSEEVHAAMLQAARNANLHPSVIARMKRRIERVKSAADYGRMRPEIAARGARIKRIRAATDEELIQEILGSKILDDLAYHRAETGADEYLDLGFRSKGVDDYQDAELAFYELHRRHFDDSGFIQAAVVDALDDTARVRLGEKWTPKQYQQRRVVQMREQNVPWEDIAEEMKVSVSTARRWHTAGKKLRTPQEAAAEMHRAGKKMPEIANKLGVSESTARRYVKVGQEAQDNIEAALEHVHRTQTALWDGIESTAVRRHIGDFVGANFDEAAGTVISPHAFATWEELETMAKAHALQGTQDLLYDVTKRHQWMDMLRNVFPFGEAFVEVLSTWTKIMGSNPQVWRRAQQTIEGAREADPLNSGKGFFFIDPVTGEEVFNYPGADTLFAAADTRQPGETMNLAQRAASGGAVGMGAGMVGGGPLGAILGAGIGAVGGAIAPMTGLGGLPQAALGGGSDVLAGPAGFSMQGSVAGLNLFAGSYIPGFGPVVQVAASHLFGDNPMFDAVRNLVLPFGDQRIKNVQDLLDLTLPRWAQRFLTAIGIQDPDQKRLFGNTVMDVQKVLILNEGQPETIEEQEAMFKRAKAIASKLAMYRSFAAFFSPTAPQLRFHAEDKEGKLWLFQTLASEYQRMLFDEFDGDDVSAFDKFWRTYGLDPTIFATPKTVTISTRSVTQEGDKWARANAALFEAAPYTAYFAHPDDPTDESFDYDAYIRQLEEDAREPLTPEQWAFRRNDTLGRIVYEKGRREIDARMGYEPSNQKTFVLRALRQFLIQKYPGYKQPNVGTPVTPSVEQKIDEIQRVWFKKDDSGAWVYPELSQSDTGKAVRVYLEARERLMRETEAQGLSRDALFTAKSTFGYREALRTLAGQLINRYEDFTYIFRLVLEHEFNDSIDDMLNLPGPRTTAPVLAGVG